MGVQTMSSKDQIMPVNKLQITSYKKKVVLRSISASVCIAIASYCIIQHLKS